MRDSVTTIRDTLNIACYRAIHARHRTMLSRYTILIIKNLYSGVLLPLSKYVIMMEYRKNIKTDSGFCNIRLSAC
jgi:hypothetical protein